MWKIRFNSSYRRYFIVEEFLEDSFGSIGSDTKIDNFE